MHSIFNVNIGSVLFIQRGRWILLYCHDDDDAQRQKEFQ